MLRFDTQSLLCIELGHQVFLLALDWESAENIDSPGVWRFMESSMLLTSTLHLLIRESAALYTMFLLSHHTIVFSIRFPSTKLLIKS